ALLTAFFARLPYLVAGIIVLFVFWLVGKVVRSIFLAASTKTNLDFRLKILFSRLIVISIFILGIFIALTIFIPTFSFGSLIAGLGFTSFIVGFATKDILNNLLSGVLILWKQPFQIGDYIFVKDKEGRVEYIGVRATTLRMDDGEMILMPNGDMYSTALVIRGASSERRMKLEISIGYDADIERAKTSIYNVLQRVEGVVAEPQPSVFVTKLAAEGVGLSILFWIKTFENKPLEVFDRVATGIKNALNDAKIELYPPASIAVQNPDNEAASDQQEAKDDFNL
ncbi:MAG: mechanosensitive ion channel, partial [Acidobacteriota bacterium]|nr:mechanosensitive ion channel [Acidobacteriota bacterium]